MTDKLIEIVARAIYLVGEDWDTKASFDSLPDYGKDFWTDRATAALSSLEQAGMVVVQGWQPIETAPKDGTIIYTAVACRWVPYKPSSEQAKRGINGRWMESNGYGGWRPCQNGEPAEWMPLTPTQGKHDDQ